MKSETMKELRKIKKKLSKELYGKSWDELKHWIEERKKKREEEVIQPDIKINTTEGTEYARS